MRPADRPIFLVGFMASGKTVVGGLLAERLGVEFVDTDDRVERRERSSVERIFAERGERYFRQREWEVLSETAPGQGRVVATGGGAFTGAEARRWMKRHGVTVWLDVGLDEARRRLGKRRDRPLWPGEQGLALRILYERRRAVYALAHLRVAAQPGDPREVAERVRARTGPFFR